MAFDTFLKITAPDVAGESTAKGMEGSIEIFSFSFGASNPVTISSGAAGISGGKVSISSFNCMKKSEMSSAELFSSCATGQHYGQALVTMRKATGKDGGQQKFIEYKFSDVMVESIQWSGSSGGDDTPTESLSLAFAKVEITYFGQDAKGALAKKGQASWDLTKVAT